MSSPSSDPSRPARAPGGTARRVLALVAAVVAALAIWALAVPVADVDVRAGDIAVGPPAIVISVLVAGVIAWILGRLLRAARRGPVIWTGVGVVVLVLSLLGPLTMGATGAALLVLCLMHLVVGAILLVGLRPTRAAGSSA